MNDKISLHWRLNRTNYYKFSNTKACSSVDRAADSDSESRGFDSLHAYFF